MVTADRQPPEDANLASAYPPRSFTATGTEQPLQFADFFAALSAHRLLLAASIGLCTAVALATALLMTPVYRAEVLLAPVPETTSAEPLSALAGGLGLMGVALGGDNKKEISIATLKSREFARAFIEKENLLPVLFYKKWDADSENWKVRNENKVPTLTDAVNRFDEKVRRIERNGKTGLVTLAIEWHDRFEAARWANLLVDQINTRLRDQAVAQAEKRIEFLNRELQRASVVELKNAIFRLIETQIKTIMMVNTSDEYAFQVIDPATVAEPENKIRPKRALIVLGGLVFGFLLGTMVAVLRGPARR